MKNCYEVLIDGDKKYTVYAYTIRQAARVAYDYYLTNCKMARRYVDVIVTELYNGGKAI